MAGDKKTCCSSPPAICYWFATSLLAWAVLSVVGVFWHPLHAASATTILFAMATGCGANWLRNRTYHCAITGPLFLIAGAVFSLPVVNSNWVWTLVFSGHDRVWTGVAVCEGVLVAALRMQIGLPSMWRPGLRAYAQNSLRR